MLTVSVSHESGSVLAGWLWLLHAAAVRTPAGTTVRWAGSRLCWGRTHIRPCSWGLLGCLTIWLLAALRRRLRESKSECPRQMPGSVRNLVSGVLAHHFCHILVFRSHPVSPACMYRRGSHKDGKTRGRGALGTVIEAANHTLRWASLHPHRSTSHDSTAPIAKAQ